MRHAIVWPIAPVEYLACFDSVDLRVDALRKERLQRTRNTGGVKWGKVGAVTHWLILGRSSRVLIALTSRLRALC